MSKSEQLQANVIPPVRREVNWTGLGGRQMRLRGGAVYRSATVELPGSVGQHRASSSAWLRSSFPRPETGRAGTPAQAAATTWGFIYLFRNATSPFCQENV